MNAPPPEFFCDRSLGGKVVPAALRAVHPHVIAHDDVFPQDTDDEVWLRSAGKNGWIVLMRDDRIRYRPGEQAAVLASGVRCFCLHPSKGMTGPDMAAALVKALPRMVQIAERELGGFIKGVDRKGRVRHLFP
ncbi:MAG: hypothetical protein WD096_07010 [Actinomycetota bacterium]